MKLKIGSILVSNMIKTCVDGESNPVFIQDRAYFLSNLENN